MKHSEPNPQAQLVLSCGFRIAQDSPYYSQEKEGMCRAHTSFKADLQQKMQPVADASGLYQVKKPTVNRIALFLELDEPSEKKLHIRTKYFSADKCLIVVKSFAPDEWPDDDYKEWQDFSELNYTEMINFAAAKYVKGKSKAETADELKADSYAEQGIHINLALSNQKFGDIADFPQHQEIMERVEDFFRGTSDMEITGCEIGQGVFTIFCQGTNPKGISAGLVRMLRTAQVPTGSFLTILYDGKQKRRQIW